MKAPALKIYAAARQYAQANGLPFWTVKDQRKAISQYVNFQSIKN